ncbi:hypothetical protein LCGC14_0476280 [marine sediment metagenome]|uniref:Uncharacterized protein n=1 Tax=marine sediment metagenome TaxID=412755 RepID=A0A0F9SAK1_9ZZZZ|nr:hypothetical protein [bacterium]
MNKDKKILIRRTEKEKKKVISLSTSLFTLLFLSILGISFLLDSITSLTICKGIYGCTIKALGDIVLSLLMIGFAILASYFISQGIVSNYKEEKK